MSSTAKSAEFILKSGCIPVLVVEPYGPSFPSILERLADDETVQVVECTSYLDAVSVARRVDACVVLAFADDPDEVVKHITMLKLLAKEIQRRQVRVIVVTKFVQSPLQSKLDLYGCSEVVPENITEKSLLFKIERHMRLLVQNTQKDTSDGDMPELHAAVRAAERREAHVATETVKLIDALELESDCWLLSGGGAKRVADRWVIRLKGPGPLVGRWVQRKSSGSMGELAWEWVPHDPAKDPFIKEEGAWIFHGQKPEFQEEEFWLFVAKRPELSFYYEGNTYGTKISVDEEGALLVAKDSSNARKLKPLILRSIEQDLYSEKAKDAAAQGAARIAAKVAAEPSFRIAPPLETKSDCWLKQARQPRWIMDRWMVKLAGPGPEVGRWMAFQAEDASEEHWQWLPTPGKGDVFIVEPGFWVFRGMMPKFQEGEWVFTGRSPKLSFHQEGNGKGEGEGRPPEAKFFIDRDGTLVIAADSAAAIQAIHAIEASAEALVLQAKEKVQAEEVPPVPVPIMAAPASEPEPTIEAEAATETESESESATEPAFPLEVSIESVSAPNNFKPGPEGVAAPRPPGPSLSPLALACLMSELVGKREFTLRQVGDRFCAYFSASCGGLRAEIWLLSPAGWTCAGSTDGDDGRALEGVLSLANSNKEMMQVEAFVAAVVYRDFFNQMGMLGAIVLSGPGAELVGESYILSAAHVVRGLLLGALTQSQKTKPEDQAAA